MTADELLNGTCLSTDTDDPITGFRRYTFQCYPSREQAAVLHDWRFLCGDLWDGGLEYAEGYFKAHGTWPPHRTAGDPESCSAAVKLIRQLCPEWRQVPAMTAHGVLESLVLARKASQRRKKELLENPALYEAKGPKSPRSRRVVGASRHCTS